MKEYIARLNLNYDPFEPGKASRDFYPGGERQHLLGELIELCLQGNSLAAVTGPLGSGKSTLVREFRGYFAGEATCILIHATLFMNQAQFIDALGKQLPKHKHIAGAPTIEAGIERICQLARELDLEAQSLILVVDDAHELSAEVLELINAILNRSGKSHVNALLLGESQLINLLENTWSDKDMDNVSCLNLEGFSSEDTLEYIRFKLANAGLSGSLPVSGGVIGRIHNSCNGIPGTINSMISEALEAGGTVADTDYADDSHFISAVNDFDYDNIDAMRIDSHEHAPDSVEIDEFDDVDAARSPDLYESASRLQAAVVNNRYWIAASCLGLILILTIVTWSVVPVATSEVAVVDASSGITRIPLELPLSQTAVNSAEVTATTVPTAAPTVESLATVPQPEAPTPATASVAPAGPSESSAAVAQVQVTAVGTTLAAAESAAVARSAPAPIKKPVVSAAVKLPGFEQKLLDYRAANFTIQLLGSHSEANVQQFIAAKPVAGELGYFESRHDNKPWFVVVLGNYQERSTAVEVMDHLPDSLRNMQPWVRPVASIQRDIRRLRKIE